MISISPAGYEDLATLAYITQQAYGSTALNQAGLERNFKVQADGFFIANYHHQNVGMVSIFDYGTFANIGALGVLPEFQGRGFGQKLMEHVEGWAKTRNIPSLILDATAEGARLYAKLGYQHLDVNHKMILETLGQSYKTPKNVRLMNSKDIPELLEFDTPIFGGHRQKVIQVMLKHYPERFFLAHNSQGKIDGFIIAQSSTIGPWVAQSEDSAENLLQAVMGLPFEKTPRVLLPGKNKSGLKLLQSYGFCKENTLRYMVKGVIPKRHRQSYLWAEQL